MDSLAALKTRLQDTDTSVGRKKWYRSLSQRAAVCLIAAEKPQLGLSLLMIQRATVDGDPWSGQMAFPGGKQDLDDPHITATALREADEELAIQSTHLARIGRLSDILARPYRRMKRPMVVTPLVFESVSEFEYSANHEVADALWVPLSLFNDKNRTSLTWHKHGIDIQLPCYHYQDKTIWGLSLMMIDELKKTLAT
ncbi:putative Nudix hydrolase NudL [BD1-7 clade bacterium]|uniref:Putative Nudix hydrolase NudL n=1 Tax=BD1-7 clade bacterium TaxID=2029982 RepID=A0A5S9MQR1_9GAMM|nr:putative Nudix hydrolase NudL [BD1-7 clade bacterium]CAA0085399.1 putative Nudix hydrolase NudL [BD1-7 clade bacterium]